MTSLTLNDLEYAYFAGLTGYAGTSKSLDQLKLDFLNSGIQLVGAVSKCVSATDQTQLSNVLADITGLVLNVTVGTWIFEFDIQYSGAAAAASPITLNVTGPAATAVSSSIYVQNSVSGKTEAGQTAFGQPFTGAAVTTANAIYVAKVRGYAVVTANGQIKLQFAGDNTNNNTVKAVSYGRADRVA